jgi:hypothetical protein
MACWSPLSRGNAFSCPARRANRAADSGRWGAPVSAGSATRRSSRAKGLGNTPLGSAGRPCRPPKTKLLALPPRKRPAYRTGKSVATFTKVCGKGAMLHRRERKRLNT